jgi:hypothetical protein
VGHSGHSNIIALMMGTETVPETLDFNELTRLSAREEFINFSRRESFTSYFFKSCASFGYNFCSSFHHTVLEYARPSNQIPSRDGKSLMTLTVKKSLNWNF